MPASCAPHGSRSSPSRRTHGHQHREEPCRGLAAPRCWVSPTDPSWDHGGFFCPTFGWDERHRGWLRPAGTCGQGTDLHPAAKTCALLVHAVAGLRLYCAEDSGGINNIINHTISAPLLPVRTFAAAAAPDPVLLLLAPRLCTPPGAARVASGMPRGQNVP